MTSASEDALCPFDHHEPNIRLYFHFYYRPPHSVYLCQRFLAALNLGMPREAVLPGMQALEPEASPIHSPA